MGFNPPVVFFVAEPEVPKEKPSVVTHTKGKA